MPTTVIRPPVRFGRRVKPRPSSPKQHPLHGWRLPAEILAVAVVVGLGSWVLVDRLTGTSEPVVPSATAPLLASEVLSPTGWIDVVDLQSRLRLAGYAVPVTGRLDRVTRSAAGDLLRGADVRRLTPWLAGALADTVLTGRQDPAAWNTRFGENRRTQLVERPLTGPDGQLDEAGNLQQP